MAQVRRWVFTDLKTGETWTVPINPNKMTAPWPVRNYVVKSTAAGPGLGTPVVYEGVKLPVAWTFSGTTLNLDHHNQLLYWAGKTGKVQIVDHFGRTFVCLLDQFDAIPDQRASHMERHTYTMHATVFWRAGPVAL